jgi:hypothetical protein
LFTYDHNGISAEDPIAGGPAGRSSHGFLQRHALREALRVFTRIRDFGDVSGLDLKGDFSGAQ